MSTIEQLSKIAGYLRTQGYDDSAKVVLTAIAELKQAEHERGVIRRLSDELEAAQKAEQKAMGLYLELQESAQACNRYAQGQLEAANKRIAKLEELVKAQSETLDIIWDTDEMGWLVDAESESATEECVKCGAVLPHGQHAEDCLQGMICRTRKLAAEALENKE